MAVPRSHRLLAVLFLAVASLLLADAAHAGSVRTLTPDRVTGSTAVFDMSGLDADRVRRAEARGSAVRRRRISKRHLRHSLRTGVLRVSLRPTKKARAAGPARKRVKVVVVSEPAPAPTEPAATEPAPTEPAPTEPAPTASAPAPSEPAPTEPAPTEPAPAPAPTEPAPAPASKSIEWRAPGSAPLGDAEAAARITRAPEIRPGNDPANRYVPSDAELQAFHGARYTSGPNSGALGDSVIPQQRFVTGRFTGTTDEILQWAAHKWGIPEDILRAVAHQESTWRQPAMGDRRTVADASAYPAQARISATEVYESMGLMQIKWRADGSMHPGTEPLRWKSTAFNVDFYGAVLRFYFDGTASKWFSSTSSYSKGQDWGSVGAWYQPTPWGNSGQLAYIDKVKAKVAQRTWEQPGF